MKSLSFGVRTAESRGFQRRFWLPRHRTVNYAHHLTVAAFVDMAIVCLQVERLLHLFPAWVDAFFGSAARAVATIVPILNRQHCIRSTTEQDIFL